MKNKITVCVILVFGVGVWTTLPLLTAISSEPDKSVSLASAFALGVTISGSVGSPLAGSFANMVRPGLPAAALLFVSIGAFIVSLLWPAPYTLGLFGAARMFADSFLFYFLNKHIGILGDTGLAKTRLTSLLMLGTQTRTFVAAPVAGVAVVVSDSHSFLLVVAPLMLLLASGSVVLIVQMGKNQADNLDAISIAPRQRSSLRERMYREYIDPGRQALSSGWFRVLVVGDAIRSLTGGALIAIMASVVASREDSIGYAFMAVAMSLTAGGLLANLVVSRVPRLLPTGLRGIAVAATAHTLVLLAVAIDAQIWIICFCAAVATAGQSVYYVGYLRLVQDRVPADRMSQWLAIDTFLSTITSPVGLALVVPVTAAVGGNDTAYLLGAAVWLLVLLVQWRPLVRESRIWEAESGGGSKIGVHCCTDRGR